MKPELAILPIMKDLDGDLEDRIKALEHRRTKLNELIALEREVSALESRLMFSQGEIANRCRIVSEIVCDHFNIPIAALQTRCRKERISWPRQIVFHLAYELTGSTYEAIGAIFNRDHGTVMHAVSHVSGRADIDPAFAAVLTSLGKACQARLEGLLPPVASA